MSQFVPCLIYFEISRQLWHVGRAFLFFCLKGPSRVHSKAPKLVHTLFRPLPLSYLGVGFPPDDSLKVYCESTGTLTSSVPVPGLKYTDDFHNRYFVFFPDSLQKLSVLSKSKAQLQPPPLPSTLLNPHAE